jgi:hypothetical protein
LDTKIQRPINRPQRNFALVNSRPTKMQCRFLITASPFVHKLVHQYPPRFWSSDVRHGQKVFVAKRRRILASYEVAGYMTKQFFES